MQVNNQDNSNSKNSSIKVESVMSPDSDKLKSIIDAGDLEQAAQVIRELQISRDQTIFQEVGRLTRALHNAIRNFHIDLDSDGKEKDKNDLSSMVDASDRLGYVVDLTEKAANKTMDLVDECIPMTDQAREELSILQSDWSRLGDRDMSADEFRGLYKRVDQFFKSQDLNYSALQSNLTNILLAQDYQDLTGQVIQGVTSLVRDVENSLIDLVKMASHVDSITGYQVDIETDVEVIDEDAHLRGHGPQIKKDESVVASQDDVDDLLSSLGF
ncbi:MAG: protein phosphatase CheZ [Saccharospirillaceae bacterium]|nr:protein phosphatase CheZ [Pseudomonadales bacterium]NRB78639.1 protein phosphatase CheZ [Saccharospirillaceae bacterium]